MVHFIFTSQSTHLNYGYLERKEKTFVSQISFDFESRRRFAVVYREIKTQWEEYIGTCIRKGTSPDRTVYCLELFSKIDGDGSLTFVQIDLYYQLVKTLQYFRILCVPSIEMKTACFYNYRKNVNV